MSGVLIQGAKYWITNPDVMINLNLIEDLKKQSSLQRSFHQELHKKRPTLQGQPYSNKINYQLGHRERVFYSFNTE